MQAKIPKYIIPTHQTLNVSRETLRVYMALLNIGVTLIQRTGVHQPPLFQ